MRVLRFYFKIIYHNIYSQRNKMIQLLDNIKTRKQFEVTKGESIMMTFMINAFGTALVMFIGIAGYVGATAAVLKISEINGSKDYDFTKFN